MSLAEVKKDGIAFFTEAMKKWNRLIELYNEIRSASFARSADELETEANEILGWFQDNYVENIKYSSFGAAETLPSGKRTRIDPIFDLVYRGSNIQRITTTDVFTFADDLNRGGAHLRGHLASIRNLKNPPKERDTEAVPLLRVRKTLSRCHLAIDQLRRRRKNKAPYLFEDEYDIQDLLHALLRLDFDDIRKEEWTPSYAGGASRIDLMLKKEKIVIEAKKTNKNLREEEIGEQLLLDIAKYKEHPDASILVCFVYDPEHWIENPEGLKHDLEKQSTESLRVEVIICPKSS